MYVQVIRHLAFEDLGSFAAVLAQRGAKVQYFEAGYHDLTAIAPCDADLLVILGGPISVNDGEDYPFLAQELAIVRQRMQADRPTLGICLGAQLMAVALGAKVYPSGGKEIGWYPLQVSGAGHALGLHWLDAAHTQMLHWHGETFDLPDGAVHLASTAACANQAFSRGEHCLALQFHPEVTRRGLERWYIGHTGEIAATEGVSVAGLRADSARYGEALERCGARFFQHWLDHCGLTGAA